MIPELYENWYAVVNKKGELLSVEETEIYAENTSLIQENDPDHPTNKIVQVTIITIPLLDFVMKVFDMAEEKKGKGNENE
jgi:hypothetical protein